MTGKRKPAKKEKEPVSYELKRDCRHFIGHRPCRFHKTEEALCPCDHYSPYTHRTLIIKLGALGDVLRTTPVLPALKARHPDTQITWLVDPDGVELLSGNPFLDRIFPNTWQNQMRLENEEFDLVLSLEVDAAAAGAASRIKAVSKKGFGLDRFGNLFPYNPEAEEYLRMSLLDPLKKANKRTYLEHVFSICGLPERKEEWGIHVPLGMKEKARAAVFAGAHGLFPGVPVVGLNVGAGRRWPSKGWPREHFQKLIFLLDRDLPCRILLFGGEEEREICDFISSEALGHVLHTGCDNPLPRFFALVNLCHVMVTADTLAMHAAFGLGKKVVALFGPTSAAEIDTFGRGMKLSAGLPCSTCYLPRCDREPHCMAGIAPETVFAAVREMLGHPANAGGNSPP